MSTFVCVCDYFGIQHNPLMKRPFALNPAHYKLQSALEMSGENHNFGPDRIAITKFAMIFDSHLEERGGDYAFWPLMKFRVLDYSNT